MMDDQHAKEEAGGEHAIFFLANECESAFNNVLRRTLQRATPGNENGHDSATILRDLHKQFRFWAGYMGVFAAGSASLDFRLRRHANYQTLIAISLSMLRDNLEHICLNQGSDSERSEFDMDDNTADIAKVAFKGVKDALRQLNQFALSIRQSSMPSGASRITKFKEKIKHKPHFRELANLASLVIQGRFPNAPQSLQLQLHKSLLDRYTRLEYRRSHEQKLQACKIDGSLAVDSAAHIQVLHFEDYSLPENTADTTAIDLKGQGGPCESVVATSETFASSFITKMEPEHAVPARRDTSEVTSSVRLGHVKFPNPPRTFDSSDNALCHYCRILYPRDKYENKDWWRRHVQEDLQPYPCIASSCDQLSYFKDRKEWSKHMTEVHGKAWSSVIHAMNDDIQYDRPNNVCPLCCNIPDELEDSHRVEKSPRLSFSAEAKDMVDDQGSTLKKSLNTVKWDSTIPSKDSDGNETSPRVELGYLRDLEVSKQQTQMSRHVASHLRALAFRSADDWMRLHTLADNGDDALSMSSFGIISDSIEDIQNESDREAFEDEDDLINLASNAAAHPPHGTEVANLITEQTMPELENGIDWRHYPKTRLGWALHVSSNAPGEESKLKSLHQQNPYSGQSLQRGQIRLLKITTRPKRIPFGQHLRARFRLNPFRQKFVKSEPSTPSQDEFKYETLELTTTHVGLEDAPLFDAVSYVWGTAPASIPIVCNGEELLVTPTAYEMLQYLTIHSIDSNRFLWIDAICINQHDPDEKAIQIPLMRSVFANASQVIVWMGLPSPEVREFMSAFPELAITPRDKSDVRREPQRLPDSESHFWTGLFSILHHDWFKRLWTFQEVVLAKQPTMMSGFLYIDFAAFVKWVVRGYYTGYGGSYIHYSERHASLLPGKPEEKDLAFRAIYAIRSARGNNTDSSTKSPIDVTAILHDLRDRIASEQVDRVWAISGLLTDELRHKLTQLTDYTVRGRTEYWNTIAGFSKLLFETTTSFKTLTIPPSINHNTDNLPSWCPHLSGQAKCRRYLVRGWTRPVKSLQSHSKALLSSGKDEVRDEMIARQAFVERHPQKFIAIDSVANRLYTRGFEVDVLSEVVEDDRLYGMADHFSSTLHKPNSPHFTNVVDFYTKALQLARSIPANSGLGPQEIPDEFLMSVVLDCRVSKHAARAFNDAWRRATADPRHFDTIYGERKVMAKACDRTLSHMLGHSFFTTKGGRFGIAHPGCRPGDKVCVFYGGEPLYILRMPGPDGGSSKSSHKDGMIWDDGLEDRPSVFCGVAFIPHLMQLEQSDAARLGPDEMFIIK